MAFDKVVLKLEKLEGTGKSWEVLEGGETVLRKVGSKHESGGASVAPSDLVQPEEQTISRGRQRLGPVQSRELVVWSL